VHVPAAETRTVTLHVPLRQLQYWSTKEQKWVMPSGERMLSVGPSSGSLPLSEEVDSARM